MVDIFGDEKVICLFVLMFPLDKGGWGRGEGEGAEGYIILERL